MYGGLGGENVPVRLPGGARGDKGKWLIFYRLWTGGRRSAAEIFNSGRSLWASLVTWVVEMAADTK